MPILADEDESIAIEKIESMYFNGEIKSENVIDEKAIFYEIREVKPANKNKIIRLEDLIKNKN